MKIKILLFNSFSEFYFPQKMFACSRLFCLHKGNNNNNISPIFTPNAIKVAQLFPNQERNRFSKTVIIQQSSLIDVVEKISQQTSSSTNSPIFSSSRINPVKGISVLAPSFSASQPQSEEKK
jgi:hypothetical protein